LQEEAQAIHGNYGRLVPTRGGVGAATHAEGGEADCGGGRGRHRPGGASTGVSTIGLPVIALVDCQAGKADELAKEWIVARSFEALEDAVPYAPTDAVFDVAVSASGILTILPRLPKGAAVLLQKPMGETLAEAGAIRDLCRRRGLTLAVNFQLRRIEIGGRLSYAGRRAIISLSIIPACKKFSSLASITRVTSCPFPTISMPT